MSTSRQTIDYLKFVITADVDHFEHWYGDTFVNFNKYMMEHWPQLAPMKCSITKVRDNGQRVYTLECWGKTSDLFTDMVPPSWWSYLRRADLRETLDGVVGDELLTTGASFILAPRTSITVAPMFSKPRKKTNQRELGGKGVRFGSRSSEHHLVAYEAENGVCILEYRAQDRNAGKIGHKLQDDYSLSGAEVRRAMLTSMLMAARDKFMTKHLGCDGANGFAMMAANLHRTCPPVSEWATQEEMDFADELAGWEDQAIDDLLKERWDTTPLGRSKVS